jgi:hypothetical protein
MGRGIQVEPAIPVEVVRASFTIAHNSGAIIRAASARGDLVGEPAAYRDHDGVLRVRISFRGRKRTMAALRIAWVLATGQWPRGRILARDSNDSDLRAANLIEVKRGPSPFVQSLGGRTTLSDRRERDAKLLAALESNPGATLPTLSRLTGSSISCCCARLQKLSEAGQCHGPGCNAALRWRLAQAAAAPPPDDLDKRILAALAVASMGAMKLARRIGCCLLTAKRRARLLTHRGLVLSDPRGFYAVTDAGRQALGEEAKRPLPPRWVKPEAVAASTAKDVVDRMAHPHALTAQEKSRVSSMAARKARAAAKAGRTAAFDGFVEFDRLRA